MVDWLGFFFVCLGSVNKEASIVVGGCGTGHTVAAGLGRFRLHRTNPDGLRLPAHGCGQAGLVTFTIPGPMRRAITGASPHLSAPDP